MMDQINPVINTGSTSGAGSGSNNNSSGGSSASSSGGGGSASGAGGGSTGASESSAGGGGGGGGGAVNGTNPLDLLHNTSVDVLQQLQQQVRFRKVSSVILFYQMMLFFQWRKFACFFNRIIFRIFTTDRQAVVGNFTIITLNCITSSIITVRVGYLPAKTSWIRPVRQIAEITMTLQSYLPQQRQPSPIPCNSTPQPISTHIPPSSPEFTILPQQPTCWSG